MRKIKDILAENEELKCIETFLQNMCDKYITGDVLSDGKYK